MSRVKGINQGCCLTYTLVTVGSCYEPRLEEEEVVL